MLLESASLYKRAARFLASPRCAVMLLSGFALFCVIGIFIPQGKATDYYAEVFGGFAGRAAFRFGLNDVFHHPVFYIIAVLLFIDIGWCSVRRVTALKKSPFSIRAERAAAGCGSWAERIWDLHDRVEAMVPAAALRRRLYRVTRTGKDTWYAERGWIRRYGSLAVHAGLMMLLVGGGIHNRQGFKHRVRVVRGQSIVEPGHRFLVRMDTLMVSYHEPRSAEPRQEDYTVRSLQAGITILENGNPAATFFPAVGRGVRYRGLRLRLDQNGLGWYYRIKMTNRYHMQWTFSVWPWSPVVPVSAEGFALYLHRFYPDFREDADGRSYSASPHPNRPRTEVWIRTKDAEPAPLGILGPDTPLQYGDFTFAMEALTPFATLYVSRQPGIAWLWIGSLLIALGLPAVYGITYRQLVIRMAPDGKRLSVRARGGRQPREILETVDTLLRRQG